ncbi:5754_t:CDS:2 [Entrophospora sp. SA101]|nr:5754_t:CDS:2 [Entrophospora sp. SA101]
MSDFAKLLQKVPMICSSTIDYYRYGPPQPSWNLKFYLMYKLIKDGMASSSSQTIENIQGTYNTKTAIDNDIFVDELILSNSLRKRSEIYIDDVLKDYNHVLLDDWRIILYLHGSGYVLSSAGFFRRVTSRIAKSTNARLFVINYRLAPQNQFPAALHDSITAYNYLIDPPNDADFLPIEPKNIIIMGDSAGGGLTMATLLAIRDSKKSLPSPAGAVLWSAWVDLVHSTPSVKDPKFEETDYLSKEFFNCAISPAWEEFEQKAEELSEKIRLNVDNKPRFWHKSFDCDGRSQLYVSNEGLAIPYVSPLLAESLGGLPPILVQVGDIEVLRDESIYLAYKAANPEKYNLPNYNAEKFEKSPYKTPTKVILEVYEEMPHGFQLFWNIHPSQKITMERVNEFIEQLLSDEEVEKELKVLRVTGKGEIIEGLKEEHHKILECENIGVVSIEKLHFTRPNDNNQ